jgi:hypothetical protein
MFNAINFAKAALVKEHLFCIGKIKFSILFYFSSDKNSWFKFDKGRHWKAKIILFDRKLSRIFNR